ncbi:MAG: sodium:proton antiporter, partial [Stellaceae bacterium]
MTSGLGLLWAAPFVGLLLVIAVLPNIAPAHWRRRHAAWTVFWAVAFVLPATLVRGAAPTGVLLAGTLLHEYVPFVLMLASLYVVTGGIHIGGTPRAGAAVNTALLIIGTLLAGAIGTLAASLLLVRPLIRINRHRGRRTHLFIFFIVLVANVGGALSPS